jgi:hypothetical protein
MRTGFHKDPVSRAHHPNSQVSDVTEFPAPTGHPISGSRTALAHRAKTLVNEVT